MKPPLWQWFPKAVPILKSRSISKHSDDYIPLTVSSGLWVGSFPKDSTGE